MVIPVKTHERTELIDVTSEIDQLVKESGIVQGLCMVYVPHTTAGVTINESADPSVKTDMLMVLNQVVVIPLTRLCSVTVMAWRRAEWPTEWISISTSQLR